MNFTLLEKPSDGRKNVLVLTVVFSKFAVAIPTRNQTEMTTAKALVKEWFMKYGVPERIHFDQGRIFEGSLIAELCKMYQAKKNHTTSNNPQLNGKCDRFNLTLAFVVPREKHRWPGHLPNLLFIYNSTVHSSTGFTPFCLFMGRNPTLPVDSMLCFGEDGEEGELNITMYVEQRFQKLKAAYEETSSNGLGP